MKGKTVGKKIKKILEISYDPIAKASYIMVSDAPVAKTVQYNENFYLDFDKENNLVGIEFIRVKKATLKIKKEVMQIADEYHIPELRKVHTEKFKEVYA